MKFDVIAPGVYPDPVYPPYRSTVKRGPLQPPLRIAAALPVSGNIAPSPRVLPPGAIDMSRENGRDAIGERIVVTGRVTDEDGKPVCDSLLEVWQCNAAGRYRHKRDQHAAPLDPNFNGWARMLTDADGRYRFVTIRPGAYPWGNHDKAFRPAHIHFSLFGNVYAQRLVTQMYFPNDPLFDYDPIYQSIPDEGARRRLIARYCHDETVHGHLLGYEFDIVLRGRDATPLGL